jgi:hypothetical protein
MHIQQTPVDIHISTIPGNLLDYGQGHLDAEGNSDPKNASSDQSPRSSRLLFINKSVSILMVAKSTES